MYNLFKMKFLKIFLIHSTTSVRLSNIALTSIETAPAERIDLDTQCLVSVPDSRHERRIKLH